MRDRRVLISTIVPGGGGAGVMTRFVVDAVAERGLEPVLAYYRPYSTAPELSVPAHRLLQRRPHVRVEQAFGEHEGHAIGAWLPELEFTLYLPTAPWRRVMESCRYHVSVSGNCLPALPYSRTGRKFLMWIASSWHEDRKDRAKAFPWWRRLLDRSLNARVITRFERTVLSRGRVLALSRYTQDDLNGRIGADVIRDVLPMPVDTEQFHPAPERVVPRKLGFTGRLSDARKNIDLLLDAMALCRQQGSAVSGELIGDEADEALSRRIADRDLTDVVEVLPFVPRDELLQRLQTFDLFVLPSHQEGLCISALEAMACGCPVVSTRCGGPEEFVVDGKSGTLVGFEAQEMAGAIRAIVEDRETRKKLAEGARRTVDECYNPAFAKRAFWRAFDETFDQAQEEPS